MGPAKRGPIWVPDRVPIRGPEGARKEKETSRSGTEKWVPDRVPICTKCIEAHEVWPMGAHGATTKKKKLCSMWVPDRVPVI